MTTNPFPWEASSSGKGRHLLYRAGWDGNVSRRPPRVVRRSPGDKRGLGYTGPPPPVAAAAVARADPYEAEKVRFVAILEAWGRARALAHSLQQQ